MKSPKIERDDNGPDTYSCGNCSHVWTFEELNDISDLSERTSAGSEVPAGECPDPECGCLCYPVGGEDDTPEQHHNNLIQEILYDIKRCGAVSIVGIVATLLEDEPEASGGPEIARALRMVELRAPKSADVARCPSTLSGMQCELPAGHGRFHKHKAAGWEEARA